VFVGKVLSNDALRAMLKEAYVRIPGGTNENSLLLYSGPSNVDIYYLRKCAPCYLLPYNRLYQAGCLFTGDSNADMTGWKDHMYSDIWGCIDTLQLPHHGSVDSFDVTANPVNKPYIFPVSCGSYNSYGHPSGKVLAYLMTNQCHIQIVTEMANTIFMEEIEKQ